jgi:hypothetical protein
VSAGAPISPPFVCGNVLRAGKGNQKVSCKTWSCPRRACGPSSRWASSRQRPIWPKCELSCSIHRSDSQPPRRLRSSRRTLCPKRGTGKVALNQTRRAGMSAVSGILHHSMEMGVPWVSSGCLRVDALTTALLFHSQTSQLENKEGAMLLGH